MAQPTDRFKQKNTEPTQKSANDRKRAAAHKHLDRMFDDAQDEQIDGRRFWGSVRLEVQFQDGVAGDILASKEARDRLQGGRA